MDRTLTFGGKIQEPAIRMLSDMSSVLLDPDILQTGDRGLYYMYRDLALSIKDREIIQENGLRYDITIIPPGMLGREYVKTGGHYHPIVPGTDITYPEVYEVLSGEAQYLLQKGDSGGVSDVVLIKASAGDKVLIPPDYGHVTINASNKELKMANWVSRDFSSVYEPFIEMHGAAYYLTKEGLIPNPNFKDVPEVREIKPRNFNQVGLTKSQEMYGLVRSINNLNFLNRPQEFKWLFEEVIG
jgi:glucose-6-phosphate isomerase